MTWSLLCLLLRVVIQVQGIPAQVQVPPLLTMENTINIVLYNCRGFRSSSDYVNSLTTVGYLLDVFIKLHC